MSTEDLLAKAGQTKDDTEFLAGFAKFLKVSPTFDFVYNRGKLDFYLQMLKPFKWKY